MAGKASDRNVNLPFKCVNPRCPMFYPVQSASDPYRCVMCVDDS